MFDNQGTRQPEASQEEKVNGDMASEWEELVELDDVQLATVVGGKYQIDQFMRSVDENGGGGGGMESTSFYPWLVHLILG